MVGPGWKGLVHLLCGRSEHSGRGFNHPTLSSGPDAAWAATCYALALSSTAAVWIPGESALDRAGVELACPGTEPPFQLPACAQRLGCALCPTNPSALCALHYCDILSGIRSSSALSCATALFPDTPDRANRSRLSGSTCYGNQSACTRPTTPSRPRRKPPRPHSSAPRTTTSGVTKVFPTTSSCPPASRWRTRTRTAQGL
eukprot:1105734-Rhodomonas_salina.3